MDYKLLISKATEGMNKAYAPFSKFKVGAALLTESGEIFTGCNVENSSYGGAICAERTAMVKAVSEGHREFKAIAIVCDGNQLAFPCGICRQFLYEFMPEGQVLISDLDFNYKIYSLNELLPHGFKL